MKKTKHLLLSIFFLTACPLIAKDDVKAAVKENLKKTKEEAKALGKEKNKEATTILESLLSNGKLETYSEEFLPEEDQGKGFDAKLAAEKTDKQEVGPVEAAFQEVLDSSRRREELEGSEDFLISSKAIIENAQKGIGVVSQSETIIPEEKNIEVCQEGGCFIKVIDKARKVLVIPQKTAEIRTCQGHKKEAEFFWKGDAEEQVKAWKKELKNTHHLQSFNVSIERGGMLSSYLVVKKWTHQEGVHCDKSQVEKRVLQEEKEVDRWEVDEAQKQVLQALEENIECSLIQTQEFDPGNRHVEGKDIFRDSWKQRLIFSCKPDGESKCKRLRDRGGVLVKRACLHEDDFGECLSWEKTYDLGGQAAYLSQKLTFKEGEELLNLDDIDPSYEKNQEFGSAISILGSLGDLKNSLPEKELDPNKASIFCGNSSKCRRSFDSSKLFDCCHKRGSEGRGAMIGLDLRRCSKEERDLFEKAKEGKCHRVGHIKDILKAEHVYCCFPTKLARIIQEEGRKQLGLDWGKPEKPKCQGLSLSQLQSIDFEKIDFTDFIEELGEKIDSQKLAEKLKSMAESYSNSLSPEGSQAKTEEKIEAMREKVKQKEGEAL